MTTEELIALAATNHLHLIVHLNHFEKIGRYATESRWTIVSGRSLSNPNISMLIPHGQGFRIEAHDPVVHEGLYYWTYTVSEMTDSGD